MHVNNNLHICKLGIEFLMHLCVLQYFTKFIYNFYAKRIAFKTQIENSNFSQSYKAKVFFYKDEAILLAEHKVWTSLICLFALSSVIGAKIASYHPLYGNNATKHFLTPQYLPEVVLS